MPHAFIVNCYQKHHLRDHHAQLQGYANLPTLKDTIRVAARCRLPDEINCHPHQYRVPKTVREAAYKRVRLLKAKLQHATNFAEIHAIINAAISNISGIGPLMVYDISLHIGMWLKQKPDQVYLHAGTKQGAAALGIIGKIVPVSAFPKAFQRLQPHAIEDLLCVCKDCLKSQSCTAVCASKSGCSNPGKPAKRNNKC